MLPSILEPCPLCRGTGIVRFGAEPLIFEDTRICKMCRTGEKLAKTMSELANGAEIGIRGNALGYTV